MLTFEGIRQAAVMEHEGGLIGFFVSDADASTENLRGHLRTHLPHHMVPGELIRCTEFPLTTRGKLDKSALIAATSLHPQGAGPTIDESTETRLLGYFRVALGRSDFDGESDFFSLGGDSLDALRVIALAKIDGLDISVAQLFGAPSARALAMLLRDETTGE
jgi:hypothetical protein